MKENLIGHEVDQCILCSSFMILRKYGVFPVLEGHTFPALKQCTIVSDYAAYFYST